MEQTNINTLKAELSQEWNKPKGQNLVRKGKYGQSRGLATGARNYEKITRLQGAINELKKTS